MFDILKLSVGFNQNSTITFGYVSLHLEHCLHSASNAKPLLLTPWTWTFYFEESVECQLKSVECTLSQILDLSDC